MLTLYGVPWSRASTCMWMLEELGASYELRAVEPSSAEVKALNPNAKVPILVDGDVVLWESLAINLYLAERIPSQLGPQNHHERAGVLQWSFWAENELDEVFNTTHQVEDLSGAFYSETLQVLDQALAGTGFLVGSRFTVADLNVTCMFNGPVSGNLDFSDHPHVKDWIESNRQRPAATYVREKALREFAKHNS